jgi:hypothetical protein
MQMQLQRRPSGLPDWLYVTIVAALGLYFVIGGIAWTTFIYNGTPVPDSFTTILATIAQGGLSASSRRLVAPLVGLLLRCPIANRPLRGEKALERLRA